MYNGFININKKSGISSNKALSILKYKLKQNNISTKVGHLGTLDPLAEGVLPVALGRACRLFDYLMEKVKIYKARFRFGEETDTLDCTGTILQRQAVYPTITEIENVLPRLTGDVDQMPPIYSAKSVNGMRAYKLARQGVSFELQPKRIRIDRIECLGMVGENEFEFIIECGGGTYIRSIARDMAAELGTVAVMTALVRTRSGLFAIENSITVDDITDIASIIVPMEDAVAGFPSLRMGANEVQLLKNGVGIDSPTLTDSLIALYDEENTLLGIGHAPQEKLIMKTWLL